MQGLLLVTMNDCAFVQGVCQQFKLLDTLCCHLSALWHVQVTGKGPELSLPPPTRNTTPVLPCSKHSAQPCAPSKAPSVMGKQLQQVLMILTPDVPQPSIADIISHTESNPMCPPARRLGENDFDYIRMGELAEKHVPALKLLQSAQVFTPQACEHIINTKIAMLSRCTGNPVDDCFLHSLAGHLDCKPLFHTLQLCRLKTVQQVSCTEICNHMIDR